MYQDPHHELPIERIRDYAPTPRDDIGELVRLVGDELERALKRFPRFNSPHEGWAVIREELDELWEHVRDNTGRSAEAQLEAIQLAAMALRYALDLTRSPA